ncbi:hypothetical protein FZEAL_2673 [Fusarium zealandicum]|uniref:Uncharacterized protein n=1 Tax=Fusarium zealandicum TaxID=1053134 RepID=A0A8H4UR24_9HYPO|nr:hypothetical protein FZEAL_2673 [Fusarium zealandicum]
MLCRVRQTTSSTASSRYSASESSPEPERSRPYISNTLIRWSLWATAYNYLATTLLLLALFLFLRPPRSDCPRPPPGTAHNITVVNRWPKGVPAVLPIYDRYFTLCLLLSTVLRDYFNALSIQPYTLRRLDDPSRQVWHILTETGGIWDKQNGLHVDAYDYITKYLRGGMMVDDGQVDVWNLCGEARSYLDLVVNLYGSTAGRAAISLPMIADAPLGSLGSTFQAWSLEVRNGIVAEPSAHQRILAL